jgi:DnaK suppressor protein
MAELTPQELEQLKGLLNERERFLTEDVQREVGQREEYVQMAGEVPDPGDQATANMLLDLNHAEVDRDISELREIESARKRIHDDNYGFCYQCGIEIPFKRLLVQPAAARCVPCQSLYERTHAVRGVVATLPGLTPDPAP